MMHRPGCMGSHTVVLTCGYTRPSDPFTVTLSTLAKE